MKLYDWDRGPDLDDLMGQTKTDSEGRFQVSGKTSEMTTIDVQLRIYHDCDDKMVYIPILYLYRRLDFTKNSGVSNNFFLSALPESSHFQRSR